MFSGTLMLFYSPLRKNNWCARSEAPGASTDRVAFAM